MIRTLAAAALVLVVTAPALAAQRALVPAPGARTLPSYPLAAGGVAAGIDVQVDAGAWRWGEVIDALKPVRVTVANRGQRPILIRYEQFALRSPWGDRLDALPPYELAGAPPLVSSRPRGGEGFVPAPWSVRAYGTGAGAAAPDDPRYDDERRGEDAPAIPPNEDVVRQALPEGILQPGGTVSGYLYFREQPKGTPLTFAATLVDATTGAAQGSVLIPLVVR